MLTTEDQLSKLLSESSSAQKKRILAELVRDMIGERHTGQPLPIQDSAGELLAFIQPLPVHVPMPGDQNSPEFLAELRRRGEQEPTLTPDQFFALLNSLD
jgi:hypothetical protein